MNNDQKNILGRISEFFINQYRVVYLIIIALVLMGTNVFLSLPREERPEIILPYGMVTVSYNGAAPNEIESLITDKVEAKLDEIDDIKSITSTSSNGLSSVFIEFEEGVDINDKLQEMRNKISDIQNQLPEDSDAPIVRSFETGSMPIMVFNISGEYDFVTLKAIAEDIKAEIEKINGISEVTIVGGLEREINVYIDPAKLATYNVSVSEIRNAISKSNVNAPGGELSLDGLNYNIRTVAAFNAVEEIENIIVSNKNSTPVFLKDVARVQDDFAQATSYSEMYVKGVSEDKDITHSISISIVKKDDADTIKPSEDIKKLLADQKGRLYPEDVFISITEDAAVEVDERLGDVTGNAISGLLLVIVVLFLFIGFRESLIVAFVIPLSLFASFILMNLYGMTFNTVSMLALILALGMLVDNAIVIMENIDRYRDEGMDISNASKIATNQVAPAVASSTLTTMAAFLSMAFMSGPMGEFLRVIPITVMFAIGSSLVISLAITPALCSRFLSKHKVERKDRNTRMEFIRNIMSVVLVFGISLYAFSDKGSFGWLSWTGAIIFSAAMVIKKFKFREDLGHDSKIIQAYTGFLSNILATKRRRIALILLALVLFVTSLATIPLGLLKIELVPATDTTSLSINVETPTGYLLEDTGSVITEIEQVLFSYPEIESFVSNVGNTGSRNTIATASGRDKSNTGKISVYLVPLEERERTSMEIVESLRRDMKDIAGAKITFEEARRGPSAGTPISIELRGDNLDELSGIANDFEETLTSINGVIEPNVSSGEGAPELQVVVHKQRASLLGLDPTMIASEIRNAIQGVKASTFKENQDEIDIMIRTYEEKFNTIKDIENIYFTNSMGEKIAFSQVAALEETKGLTAIDHDDLQRIVKVEADLSEGITMNEVLKEFQLKIKDYPMPEDISVSYGGEAETTEDTFAELFLNLIMAVILVYIILAIQFNSLSQPLTILFSVPLAVVGVMPGLILTNNSFGMYGFMGIVSLVGIAVNDAIVLVDYINYLKRDGYDMKDAIVEAGKTRFMPVLATSITTIGGILPLALKDLEYGQMGFALIFGLMTSTLLTLIFIPVLYSLSEEFKGWFQKKVPVLVERQ
ncbi:MAG: efflux RND transporter permease subunit [Bacillota bacterium]